MPPILHYILPSGRLGTLAALLCVGSGLSALARRRRPSDVCVLTFHGLIDQNQSDSGLIDERTHTTVALFEELCNHLAESYNVISSSELVEARINKKPLPENSVVLTFDDGYESNYALAWPILRRLKLPATIFLVSGYLDKVLLPWYIRLEMALKRTSKLSVQGLPLRTSCDKFGTYVNLCQRMKDSPWVQSMALLESIEDELEVHLQPSDHLPPALRPMSWDMARELQASGLIELGGHTHTHPVLGRCTEEVARFEVETCAERLRAELGHTATSFAYPNGRPQDFNVATIEALKQSGFTSAYSMVSSFVAPDPDLFALPRYGSPESTHIMEAMLSGVAYRLRQLRTALRPPPKEVAQ